MNCQQISKHLYNYCDDKIAPNLKVLLEEHLKECNSCNNNYKLTMIENEVLRNPVTVPSLSDDFTQRVMQSIAPNQKIQISAMPVRKRWLPTAMVASTALVLLSIGIHFSGLWWSPNETKVAESLQTPQSYSKLGDRGLAAGTGNTKDLTTQIARSDSADKHKQSNSKIESIAKSIDRRSESEVSRFRDAAIQADSVPTQLSAIPTNVPPEFTLTEVHDLGTESTYHYSNEHNDILEIKLAMQQKEPAMTEQNMPDPPSDDPQFALKSAPRGIALMSPAKEEKALSEEIVGREANNTNVPLKMNSLTLTKVINQVPIEITINSSLTEEALSLIADTIGFKEK